MSQFFNNIILAVYICETMCWYQKRNSTVLSTPCLQQTQHVTLLSVVWNFCPLRHAAAAADEEGTINIT